VLAFLFFSFSSVLSSASPRIPIAGCSRAAPSIEIEAPPPCENCGLKPKPTDVLPSNYPENHFAAFPSFSCKFTILGCSPHLLISIQASPFLFLRYLSKLGPTVPSNSEACRHAEKPARPSSEVFLVVAPSPFFTFQRSFPPPLSYL